MDSGATRYQASCAHCHGADGRGAPTRPGNLTVRPPNLADCHHSTAEPDEAWVDIVRDGGGAYGLSSEMPAFGETLTREELEAVVRYVRSLCTESGWPPGKLNFPRATLTEKAFPEDEVVIATHGTTQEYIYERRIGRRGQIEAVARTTFDSLDDPFNGVTAAFKYNVWHSGPKQALFSVGVEATPPLGRQDLWEVEPFLAAGTHLTGLGFLQGELAMAWEDTEGIADYSYSVALGRDVGRFVPMIEVGGKIPRGGESELSLVPQILMRLSRLGHIAGSLGVDIPLAGPDPRDTRITAFLLWDFADAGLFKGW